MLITNEEAERRLASPKNLINSIGLKAPVQVLETPKKTVTPPIKDTQLRVIAGTEAHFKSAAAVAKELGITQQQVNSAKNSDDLDLRAKIERSVEQVQELALLRTIETLQMLSAEEIAGEKPRDRAAIAASLSRVYGNTSRSGVVNADNRVQFVVFAPTLKNETHYDVLEAGIA